MTYSFFPNDFHSLPNLQDNATMNYLTQYYKNLAEQLQEKLNNLTELLEAYPGGMTPEKRSYTNNQSADAYQAERAKHLKAGTYES